MKPLTVKFIDILYNNTQLSLADQHYHFQLQKQVKMCQLQKQRLLKQETCQVALVNGTRKIPGQGYDKLLKKD